ncbi:MAG TPA: hypothetical protein DC024_15180 [Clostridiales bacterium]|nr:hypothetical protein [Clostridiales bacterium]
MRRKDRYYKQILRFAQNDILMTYGGVRQGCFAAVSCSRGKEVLPQSSLAFPLWNLKSMSFFASLRYAQNPQP